MNSPKSFFKAKWELIKKIPWYVYPMTLIILFACYGLYRLGVVIAQATGRFDSAFIPKIAAIDDNIPLLWGFAFIYIYAFPFWFFNFIGMYFAKKEKRYDFLIAFAACTILCFVIYCVWPTYFYRTDEILEAGKNNWLLGIIYGLDGNRTSYNAIPSLHCLISALCYLGVMGDKDYKLSYRIYSFVTAIMISISTLYTRQHYFLDVISGIGTAVFMYCLIHYIIKPGEKIVQRQNKTNN